MGTKIQARLGVQLSFVFVCPWAKTRWLKSQSCILVTIAVTWTRREGAEIPPVSEPCLCWVPPSLWSPAYKPGLLWVCFARQQGRHLWGLLLHLTVCSIQFFIFNSQLLGRHPKFCTSVQLNCCDYSLSWKEYDISLITNSNFSVKMTSFTFHHA